MPDNQNQRPLFFEGQYLGAEDLTAAVAYARTQQARHALGAHTWGIAAGLQLTEKDSPAGGGQVDTYIQPGYAWDGWSLPVYHCRADNQELRIELSVPKGAGGTVRLYMIDPDNFEGGRKQTVSVTGKPLGLVENFQEGRWLERVISPAGSADAKILIQARNMRQGSNAVLSIIEWIAAK